MDHFKKVFHEKGILGESVFLITIPRKTSTNSHYESTMRKQSFWYAEVQIDTVNCPPTNVLNFLTSCHHEGYGFGAIITKVYQYIMSPNGFLVRQHRLSTFLSEIFDLKTLQTKITFTWDVKRVFQFLLATGCSTFKDLTLNIHTYSLTLTCRGIKNSFRQC